MCMKPTKQRETYWDFDTSENMIKEWLKILSYFFTSF